MTLAIPAAASNGLLPPSSAADSVTAISSDAQSVRGATSVLQSGSQAITGSYLASFPSYSVIHTSQASLTPEITTTKDHKGAIIGGIVGGVLSLLILILILIYLRRRRHHREAQQAALSPTEYRQELMVVRRIETNRFYDDNEDFGYGWNEKVMGGKPES
ncbi:hypothetical protein PQX77_013587 [Marasmius sp. AFHP31]|nr:hypothetical protein PQX77_013587 [Marasmius sp. AFHP31]